MHISTLLHHFHNLLLHVANTLLLFWIFKRMTGAVWPSAFVAAVFAVHPLNVESVAWAAQRKSLLSALFWMLTIAAYLRYAEKPTIGRFLPVLLVLWLGLMAKPMLVTLPFVLLLLDYWPLGRLRPFHQTQAPNSRERKPGKITCKQFPAWFLIAEKVPLFILAAVSSVITFIVQRTMGAMELAQYVPLKYRLINAVAAYVGYINKIIYPRGLAIFYPHPGDRLGAGRVVISLLTLAVISAAVIRFARQKRYLAVGWLWYAGTLVPVIGLIQVGGQAMADRYAYLPAIGILIMVAWAGAEVTAVWPSRKTVLKILSVVALVALLICTRIQLRYWQNGFAVCQRAVAVTKNNFAMHTRYGAFLSEKGQVEEAIKHFKKAVEIQPDYAPAYASLAHAYHKQGRLDDAVKYYSAAIELAPNTVEIHYGLGVALFSRGQPGDAIAQFQKVLQLDPDNCTAYNSLGAAMLKAKSDLELTAQQFRKAVELKPDYLSAHLNLATVLVLQNKFDDAIAQCRQALAIYPDDPRARQALQAVMAQKEKSQMQQQPGQKPRFESHFEVIEEGTN